ncbi:MAG: hypothetical protein ACO1TE_13510 [Prosthecobacter sp.]
MPGALALVAASAIGSFLGARLGARPLAVAAGATVLAWLNRKKAPTAIPVPSPAMPAARMRIPPPQPAPEAVAAPALEPTPASPSSVVEPPLSVPIPAPEPAAPAPFPFLPAPPDPAMDPRIQAWLARQMDREERAAAQENIILSAPEAPAPAAAWLQPEAKFEPAAEPGETAEATPAPAAPFPFAAEVPAPVFSQSFESGREEPYSEADDDYRPEPLVADTPTEHSAWQPHSFAALTEPLPAPQPTPTSPLLPPQPASPLPQAAMTPAEPGVMPPAVTHTPAQPPPPAKTEEAPRPVFASSFKPSSQPLPARRPPTTPLAAPFIAASAIPGIEPLPSWNETAGRQPQPTPTPTPTPSPSPSAVVPPMAAAAPLPPLSTAPASVGVDLESLFDTPVFQGSPLPDEIHVAELDPGAASMPASIPLFTAAPQTLSTPPVLPRSGVDAPGPALAAAAPSPSSAPAAATPASPPSPWLAPANTPLFAEAPPVLKAPLAREPAPPSPSPSATTPSDFSPPKPPPASPREEDPMADFFRVPEQPAPAFSPVPASADSDEDTPAPQTPPVPEIAVHVAAAGEAWFDSPLAGAGAGVPNPWLPPKGDVEGADVPLTSSFAPLVPSSPLAPIVEAEVVLRPRAPTQASVVSKNPLTKPAIVDSDDPTSEETPSQPDVPAQSPREQRARTNWRSWWKGD